MFGKKLRPEEVFTPKGSVVNADMYIDRPHLENALIKAIRKPKHIIIHGESGSGKTWLYKSVFKNHNIRYEVINAASVITLGSLSSAITSILSELKPVKNVGYDEKKSAKTSIAVLEGQLEHVDKYEYSNSDPFFELLKLLDSSSKSLPAFIVIENVEHLVNNEKHVKDMSATLLYLDDDRYSKYNVRILIVGTPTNIRDYFSNQDNSQTIINRVQEIPEVSVLTDDQTASLSKKGLFEKLSYKIDILAKRLDGINKPYDEKKIFSDISWYTANVPQYIHELCLELSLDAENNNCLISQQLFYESLFAWLKCSLVSEHAVLEQNINSVETKHGRRNQVIFAMAHIFEHEFNYQEIEREVRIHFPESTTGRTLNVSGVLSELSAGQYPIIRKVPKGSRYRFIDPKLKIIARWMLTKKSEDSEILKITKFDESMHLF